MAFDMMTIKKPQWDIVATWKIKKKEMMSDVEIRLYLIRDFHTKQKPKQRNLLCRVFNPIFMVAWVAATRLE